MTNSEFLKRLGLKHPLIVAPMAGGPSTPELVIESCRAGALGSIGAAYSSPADIRTFVGKVRAETDAPFAVNLFCPEPAPVVSTEQLQRAMDATAQYRRELGLPTPNLTPPYAEDFDAQFETVLDLKPAVLSFVFGVLSVDQTRAAKAQGIYLIGTATSLDEAEQLVASGVDAITLQGFEAGGHRGIFDRDADDPEIKMRDLLKLCVSKIRIPLIAAGGIMNREQIKSVLSAGATAVQMGTAFLACKEAGTSAPYRASLSGSQRSTKTTRVFSGRFARGIQNRFMNEMEAGDTNAVLSFPAQNKFTRDLRTASVKQNSSEFLSLWAGTGTGTLWQDDCGSLILRLFK